MTAIDRADFESLLQRVAASWSACDAVAAADCFTADAVYMEPPDRQLFRGREELLSYFSPLRPGTYLEFHGIWFDVQSQTGAAEFSFGMVGDEQADHGVVALRIEERRIASWREYVRPGPAGFDRFVATTGKTFRWHAGNYP